MKLTTAYEVLIKPGIVVLYKVAASVTIYKGSLVGLNGEGLAVPMTGKESFIGIAEETAANTGSDGAFSIRVSKSGSGVYPGVATQKDIGKDVVALDDGTVRIDDSTGCTVIGTATALEVTLMGEPGIRVRIDNHTI